MLFGNDNQWNLLAYVLCMNMFDDIFKKDKESKKRNGMY